MDKSLQQLLENERKELSKQDALLQEAERILSRSRLSEKNILDNLKFYNSSFEFLDDDEIEKEKTFTQAQIKNLSKKLRLRFLPSQHSASDIPYEAVLKIKDLNKTYRKDLKHFKIISTANFFTTANVNAPAMLFAQTLYGNYYLVHTWGKSFSKWRAVKFFVLRNFESLFACLFLFTLAETLLMPNHLLTTDVRAGYFSLYRAACIFHLLILNAAFTVFGFFNLHLNFSENIWDSIPKQKQK
ncbi:MAG TPA: hypothetical protein VKG26_04145 [Bacteroidia bacterium]|nr:hypothetical protein [Bacteroidia bacterium]